ncbi:hypothetical protein SAMN05216436_101237 [bacterium A37T11]|nr:hypothetical protein SAMN05216436_101237 [bacterium A37T11]
MKRILLYTMAFVLLLQACSGLLVLSAFYANRSYISKYLCENRFNPNSACHGQCVLMKKMRKELEKEQKQPDLKFKEVVMVPGHMMDYSITYPEINLNVIQFIPVKLVVRQDPYIGIRLRPPLAA